MLQTCFTVCQNVNKQSSNTLMTIQKLLFIGALSSLRQFLATEISLKMMRNAFYFISKAFLVLKIFTFLS